MQEMFKGMGSESAGVEGMAEDPFMKACSQMFKDFDQVSKEGGSQPPLSGKGEDP